MWNNILGNVINVLERIFHVENERVLGILVASSTQWELNEDLPHEDLTLGMFIKL